jgi:hypothetical protein
MESIRACICDWKTDDEKDYANAMVVHKSLMSLLDDVDMDDDMLPPRHVLKSVKFNRQKLDVKLK